MPTDEDLLSDILDHETSPRTLAKMLEYRQKQGDHGEVVRRCLKALDAFPEDIALRRLLAESLLAQGAVTLAEIHCSRAADQVEALSPVFQLQAQIYERQGRKAEAETALAKSQALLGALPAPKIADAGEPKGMEPSPEPSVPAPTPTDESIEEEPEAMEAHTDLASATLAELYYHQGQIQEAVQTYERVLEARPNDAKAQSRLNELNRLLHRPESPATEPIAEARRHTERLVAVFGGWLERIQEMSHAPQSH